MDWLVDKFFETRDSRGIPYVVADCAIQFVLYELGNVGVTVEQCKCGRSVVVRGFDGGIFGACNCMEEGTDGG